MGLGEQILKVKANYTLACMSDEHPPS